MIEIKYNICDEVFYFNDASQKIESNTVQGVRVTATSIHANEQGKDVLDSFVILYALKNGITLTENAAFTSKEECAQHYAALFASI